MRPNPLAPSRALSSLAPSGQVSPIRLQIDMGFAARSLPTHRELVIQRKEALRADLKRWSDATGQSRAQFADRLNEISGERVTERVIAHWLDCTDDGLRWRMSAEMGVFWSAITECTYHFDELLDEIERCTVHEHDREIATHVRAQYLASEGLASALRRLA